jgi:hypothetical protein
MEGLSMIHGSGGVGCLGWSELSDVGCYSYDGAGGDLAHKAAEFGQAVKAGRPGAHYEMDSAVAK